MIFKYSDYKAFVRAWVEGQPHKGRGLYRAMALNCDMSSVLVSQIFKGARDLTPDQGLKVCEFLKLTEGETEYFLLLLIKERAGTQKLRTYYLQKIEDLRTEALQLKKNVPSDLALSKEDQAEFYSSWIYSAIRLASSLPGVDTVEEISTRLDLPRKKVAQVVDFLLEKGLCISKGNKISMGPSSTHLEGESPLVVARQNQWRLKAMEVMPLQEKEHLFYTGPMVLSEKSFKKVREDIVQLIQKVVEEVGPSKEEKLACLNIDWFELS